MRVGSRRKGSGGGEGGGGARLQLLVGEGRLRRVDAQHVREAARGEQPASGWGGAVCQEGQGTTTGEVGRARRRALDVGVAVAQQLRVDKRDRDLRDGRHVHVVHGLCVLDFLLQRLQSARGGQKCVRWDELSARGHARNVARAMRSRARSTGLCARQQSSSSRAGGAAVPRHGAHTPAGTAWARTRGDGPPMHGEHLKMANELLALGREKHLPCHGHRVGRADRPVLCVSRSARGMGREKSETPSLKEAGNVSPP